MGANSKSSKIVVTPTNLVKNRWEDSSILKIYACERRRFGEIKEIARVYLWGKLKEVKEWF